MKRAKLSNTEAIVATPMRPACPGEPFGEVRTFLPIEDVPYRCTHGARDIGVGDERFGGANVELGNHKGFLAPK